ncbi:high affinity immunoglobulin gamma Fc receptor I [Esox lucius]|uniref:Ig-like domain-containing protein n=1 Tax=Esox lucius TaxID=8010 RepID=A0AAY5JYL0_ESOLU|nr:high affinity immunoglobulin gamma Fc receptor I [Esox lucius]
MKLFLSLLVVSTLSQWVLTLVPPTKDPQTAVAELVEGKPWIFSGENIRLTCSIPGDLSDWRHQWFRGDKFIQESKDLVIWKAMPQQSGKYYCQGIRKTWIYQQRTPQSLPVEIKVDGGWAILRAPSLPMLVGETMTLSCDVRDNPRLTEVILYHNGVEIQRQSDPKLRVTNLTLRHPGSYWCRATWHKQMATHSVISLATTVSVLDILTEPFLEIVPQDPLIPKEHMLLVCHVQLNAREKDLMINYNFYQDGLKLGPASSNDRFPVLRASGLYSCTASVPILELKRESEPVAYKRVN